MMNTVTPTCEADGAELTIHITDENDGLVAIDESWSTQTMTFEISVIHPDDYINNAATVTAMIVDADSSNVYAMASSTSISVLEVDPVDATSTTMSVEGDSTALISWGIDPTNEDVIGYGGAIYADKFCLTATQYSSLAQGNCHYNGDTEYTPLLNTNAIELTWTLPAG